jgi:hypothetical protein
MNTPTITPDDRGGFFVESHDDEVLEATLAGNFDRVIQLEFNEQARLDAERAGCLPVHIADDYEQWADALVAQEVVAVVRNGSTITRPQRWEVVRVFDNENSDNPWEILIL